MVAARGDLKAEAFFKEEFHKRITQKNKTIYTYTTCATDTNNMRVVFSAMQDIMNVRVIDAGWSVM